MEDKEIKAYLQNITIWFLFRMYQKESKKIKLHLHNNWKVTQRSIGIKRTFILLFPYDPVVLCIYISSVHHYCSFTGPLFLLSSGINVFKVKKFKCKYIGLKCEENKHLQSDPTFHLFMKKTIMQCNFL